MSNISKPFGILIPESGGDAGLTAYSLLNTHAILKDVNWELVSIDADEFSPSYFHLNFHPVPYATNEAEYIKKVDELITKYDIKLVMPTGDFDPKTLTAYRMSFIEKGVILAMSQPEVYDIMEDKLAFYHDNKEVVAPTYSLASDVQRNSPYIFIKPRYGVGSRGARTIHITEGLTRDKYSLNEEETVYQPLMEGTQYTVDVLCSLDGQPLQAVTRKVYRLKGGADCVAHVMESPKMEKIAMDICNKYGVIGAACFEFMFTEEGEPKIIDAQPRLSGGHEFTDMAGLNIPVEIVNMVQGKTFKKKPIKLIEGVRTLEGIKIV